MKSTSMAKPALPPHIGDVVRPRAVRYSGAFAHCGSRRVSARRILPITCSFMCSVSRVSTQASYGSSGHSATCRAFEVPITTRSYRPTERRPSRLRLFQSKAGAADGDYPNPGVDELGAQPAHLDVDDVRSQRLGLIPPGVLGDRLAVHHRGKTPHQQ